MSATILERARNSHEMIERYEQAIISILDEKCSGQKSKTYQQHKVNYLLNSISTTNDTLLNIYNLTNSHHHSNGVGNGNGSSNSEANNNNNNELNTAMKDELSSMRGPNMFSTFYGTLKNINEYHHKYPNISHLDPETSQQINIPDFDSLVKFSGEEIFGKYLDLHALYIQYCNLPGVNIQNLDYLQYLDKFNSFFYIPEGNKLNKVYGQYVTSLWDYLLNYFQRVQPLVDMNEYYLQWNEEFIQKWNTGQLLGWKAPRKIYTGQGSGTGVGAGAGGAASTPTPLRLGMFNSPEELEALGLDRLKEGLEALGLKCSGTLSERAQRLWSVRGKKPEDIPANLKAKKSVAAAAAAASSSATPATGNQANGHGKDGMNGTAAVSTTFISLGTGDDGRRQIAQIEFYIQSLCSILSETVSATRRHAEKQQTRTFEEKQLLIEEEEYGNLPDVEVIEEEDDDGPLYNPLNLPLGWDGKPIPYWLYKLHGLGTEYKCEICGNQSYWGRRAFDRHFQEWRHAHGMRCLGVPNTKHFHDITLIEDALLLYAKVKESMKKEQFYGDLDEEFEDTEGNVLNRRTYEDLARQGLL